MRGAALHDAASRFDFGQYNGVGSVGRASDEAVSQQLSTDYPWIRQKARFFADFSFDRDGILLLIPAPAQPRFLPGIGP